MASIGSRRASVFVLALVFVLLSCQSKSNNSPTKTSSDRFIISEQDIPGILSGIWYHSPNEMPNHIMSEKLSWGTVSCGYWNALVIDLLGENGYIRYADGGGDRVIYNLDKNVNNLVHVGLSNGPGEHATINVISKKQIQFEYINAEGQYYREASGTFYKVVSP